MPELPDIEAYLAALRPRLAGTTLAGVRIANPFLLRTVSPPLDSLVGRRVVELRRLGKRIVIGLEGEAFLVIHLMVAGRLRWEAAAAKIPARLGLAAFDFAADISTQLPPAPVAIGTPVGGKPPKRGRGGAGASELAGPGGTLILTEAGSKRRAALFVVEGEVALARLDPGGLEPLTASAAELATVLRRERHTLKRALTDPHLISGIGNAYSDEILHRAKLSPFTLTTSLDDAAIAALGRVIVSVLSEWRDRFIAEVGQGFPAKVTAFRDDMAVHGRYGKPCPVCATPVQRLVYAENEANYCPTCQTEGRVLADRALSRLLKDDWPRTVSELEERFAARFGSAGR